MEATRFQTIIVRNVFIRVIKNTITDIINNNNNNMIKLHIYLRVSLEFCCTFNKKQNNVNILLHIRKFTINWCLLISY